VHPLSSSMLVFVGAGIGGLARFAVGAALPHADGRLPTATLTVNLTGCLVAGLLAPILAGPEPNKEPLRLLLAVGLLGGFTTFSAFGRETADLLSRGHSSLAAAYVGLSVVPGLMLSALGWWISTSLRSA